MADERVYRFPTGFRWGTATSSHQVEGDNFHNDWWAWEQLPDKILGGQGSGKACDWWAGRAEEDFARAQATGQNAHRLSVEWSRVEPRPGAWDEAALDRYREMVRAMRRRGIVPTVTLHHFTNPVWLAEDGGWRNSKVVGRFERFVRKVVRALCDDVTLWCTINEPNIYALCAYALGSFPPGERSLRHCYQTAAHMLAAHAAAYHAIHDLRPGAMVGLAINLRVFDPVTPASPLDRALASGHHLLFNELFPAAVCTGSIRLPLGRVAVRGVAGTLDFLGVNYYTRDLVSFAFSPWQGFSRRSIPPGSQTSDGGYGEIYAEGLYRVLRWAAGFGRPIYITENGLPDNADRQRPRFIVTHVHQAWRALQAGVPLLGYYYWSLVDNFEWERGWTSRFGLWAMDQTTQARELRQGGKAYAEICRANALTCDLLRRYAPELLPDSK